MNRLLRALARLVLSTIFVVGGADSLRQPEPRTYGPEKLGLPAPRLMVQIHGVGMLVAGIMLALGLRPKLAALLLAGNLVPTSVAGHAFWEEQDQGAQANQMVHFLKNASLLGALLGVLADPGNARRNRAARGAAKAAGTVAATKGGKRAAKKAAKGG